MPLLGTIGAAAARGFGLFGAVAAAGDFLWNYVVALFNTTATNGAQNNTFLDSSTNNFTITRNGNTTQGSFSPYITNGYWSAFFPDSGSSNSAYITTSISGALATALQGATQTREMWINRTHTADTLFFRLNGSDVGTIYISSGNLNVYNGSIIISVSAAAYVPVGVWTHIAVTLSGGVVTLWVNGQSAGTASGQSFSGSTGTLQLGGANDARSVGYMSNVRVSNTARYSSAFTPSTTPFAADANTYLLCFQSNRFIDNSSTNNTLTIAVGSPSIQAYSPFGNPASYSTGSVGGSGYFDGSGDYLSLTGTALSTGDFTVEFWLYPTTLGSAFAPFSYGTSDNTSNCEIYIKTTGAITWYTFGEQILSGTGAIVANQWQHIAACRSSGTTKLFVNGVQVGSNYSDSRNYTSTTIYLGQGYGVSSTTGYITNFRQTNTAVYTSAFTPPTSPVTAITGTQLLANFTNAGIYDAAAVNDFETAGNAQVSTTQAKFGTTSMYFDGTGDYLVAPTFTSTNAPSANYSPNGPFTVECWINPTNLSTRSIVGYGTSSTIWVLQFDGSNKVAFKWVNTTPTVYTVTSGSSISTGVWTHVAATYTGASIQIFVNGVLEATTATTGTLRSVSNPILGIGSWGGSFSDPTYYGYIDELRITNGYVRYWYNFQPPTTAFPTKYSAQVIPANDPLFPYVTMLLPGNGTNGAQNNTFLDSSTNNFTITRNGNTTQGTFTPYGSNWSNYFDGTGDYLQLASNSALNMNTYCCLEAWVCYTTIGTSTLIVGRDTSYWLGYNFTGIGGTANKFVFTIYNGSSWQAVSSNTTPIAGVWYHVVGIKDNTTLRIYINGMQENTATFSGTPATPANVMGIGANQNTQNMAGYVSNARLVLGASASVLPYTANFTSPTSPLTAVSGTALLTCQSNRFVDNSSNAFTITRNGDVSVQVFSPFSPSAAYSTSTVGGSGYFDGSGDYLSLAANAAFACTGDFTYETWFYSLTNAGSYNLYIGTSNNFVGNYFGIKGSSYVLQANNGGEKFWTGNPTVNAWTHIALVRSGSTVTVYQNGVSLGTNTDANTFLTSTDSIYLGQYAAYYATGYFASTRLVKGTAVYTGNFTPPTAPLTAITNTSLLANFTNGGVIDNSMMMDGETVGSAQISTTQSKFGGSSLYTPGGSGVKFRPNGTSGADAMFGTGDFTIELWVYITQNTANAYPIGCTQDPYVNDNTSINWMIATNQGGYGTKLCLLLNNNQSGVTIIAGTSTLSNNTWIHLAATRQSGTVRLFVNGNLETTTANTNNVNTPNSFVFANWGPVGGDRFAGYIDDLRVTKGIARYVQNFTPPTQAFQTS